MIVGSKTSVVSRMMKIATVVVTVRLQKKAMFSMNSFSSVMTIASFVKRMVWLVA